MDFLLIACFVLGYLLIALENQVNLHKSGVALLMAALCWTILASFKNKPEITNLQLAENLANTGQIVIFLLGAMIIVELISIYHGFEAVTSRIRTTNAIKLLWIVSIMTFMLSAVLDNLTTAIVMVSLIRKLIPDNKLRIWFASMVIVAANAGGAWSPIGDVTTTMLWIGKKITPVTIIVEGFLPSLISLLVPLLWLTWRLPILKQPLPKPSDEKPESMKGSQLMLGLGLGALLFVPIYKEVTHLPPYMGILLGLGVVWLVADWLHHKHEDPDTRRPPHAMHALARIDASSVLFFLGILSAIGALEVAGVLEEMSVFLQKTIGNESMIVVAIGVLSAVVDNVPLVAGVMGMYDPATHPTDHPLWIFLAYCAGTGGSMLTIGSAAGVAVMGMEKVPFGWYLKKMSLLILAGYLAGAAAYLLLFGYH